MREFSLRVRLLGPAPLFGGALFGKKAKNYRYLHAVSDLEVCECIINSPSCSNVFV